MAGVINRASKSSCIVSHLIEYYPRSIYFFKVNNAGWEVIGFLCNNFKVHIYSLSSQNLSLTTYLTVK